MTREDAIEIMRKNMPSDKSLPVYEALHTLIPELKESEDEKIRKEIISALKFANVRGVYDKHIAYLEKQKEQKSSQTDTEKEYVRTLKSLISDFLHGKQEIDTEYYQQIYDWLDEIHIEQKVLPGFDGLTPEEKMNHPLYLEGFDVGRDVQKVFDEQKPEWGEEDKRKLNRIYEILGQAADERPFGSSKRIIGDKEAVELQDFIKSLRPSWKPSEEQMRFLLAVINEPNNAGSESCHLVLKELYEQLKRL